MHRRPHDIRRRVRRLLDNGLRADTEIAPLTVAAWHVHGEPVLFDTARAAAFEPFPVGGAWGGAWDTTWFRLTGRASEPALVQVDLGFGGYGVGFGAEGLAYDADGRLLGGLSPQHRSVPVDPGPVGLYVEAAANPVVRSGPPLPPLHLPDYTGAPLYRLGQARLVRRDEEVLGLRHDLVFLLDLEAELRDGEARKAAILAGLQNVADLLEPGGSTKEARALLAPLLISPANATGLTVHAVGNSHLDLGWLWPFRETRRKSARTLSTALSLADERASYRFAVTSPQALDWLRQDYPELFERVVAAVRAGRVEVVGACWVECDGNLPSGESLARQLLYGTRWTEQRLGIRPREVWLPDSFGYSAGWPALAAHAGIRHMVTQKISWNDTNVFPHSTFWWEGLDGSRILVHLPPAATYSGDCSPGQLRRTQRDFREAGVVGHALYLYGHGDGGGGPTRAMVDRLARAADCEGVPRVVQSSVRDYLDAAEADASAARDTLAVHRGELYLEYHRGTYTTQDELKQLHRQAELALFAAELWSVATGPPQATFTEAWQSLLLQEFHDVLPGSSIRWVNDDARASLREVIATAMQAAPPSGAVPVVRDASPGRRAGVVVVDDQPTAVDVPAHGYAPLRPVSAPPVIVDGLSLDNGILRVTVDPDSGLITSVFDREQDREVLSGPGNLLQLWHDEPLDYDAWDLDVAHTRMPLDLPSVDGVSVTAGGPVRASIDIRRRGFVQRVTLDARSRTVECTLHVTDWHEAHRLLTVAWPVAIAAQHASYDVQWGILERSLETTSSWSAARYEVPAQKWAALAEPGYVVALFNTGQQGYRVEPGHLRLSLLRSPVWPDPSADRGEHILRYGLYCAPGDLRSARVTEEAIAFNTPLAVGRGAAEESSVVGVAGLPGVIVTAVKPAEDDLEVVVIRLYEAYGGRGRATIVPGFGVRDWWPTDVFERPLDVARSGPITLDLTPFTIRTVALRRG